MRLDYPRDAPPTARTEDIRFIYHRDPRVYTRAYASALIIARNKRDYESFFSICGAFLRGYINVAP